MGVCSYGSGTIPAHSKQFCEDHGGTWSEGTPQEKGFQGNILIGKDFGNAVLNSLEMEGGDGKEKFGEYVERRFEDDPAGLAMDALLYGVGGGYSLLGKLGLKGAMKAAFTKQKKLPEVWKLKKQPPKDFQGPFPKSAYDITSKTKRVIRPYAAGGTAVGLGLADQLGYTPYEPLSARGKEAREERQRKAILDAKAGIDLKDAEAKAKELAEQAKVDAQNKIDNMSFFDKWKLGMKDPTTAALFGAGLRDIGSNIPGQNQMGELQASLAAADAKASKPNTALHNVGRVSDKELMKRFTSKKRFVIGSKEEEERKATYKLGMYRALEAQLLRDGLPADDVTIMRLLEEDSKRP